MGHLGFHVRTITQEMLGHKRGCMFGSLKLDCLSRWLGFIPHLSLPGWEKGFFGTVGVRSFLRVEVGSHAKGKQEESHSNLGISSAVLRVHLVKTARDELCLDVHIKGLVGSK